jgi:response regulator of citrate/malate metabolism
MMSANLVLLVDDDPSIQLTLPDYIQLTLGMQTVVLVAGTVSEAENHFWQNIDMLDFILLDTQLAGGETTFLFAQQISSVFRKPIIAISHNKTHRQEMVRVGCTHECSKSLLDDVLLPLKGIL